MSRTELLDVRPWPEPVEPISVHGVRYYPCPDGVKRVSVTSVEKAANYGSADNLFNWYEKNGKEVAIEAAERLFDWMQSKRKMDAAADIGTLIHAMIQHRMRKLTGHEAGPEPKLNDEAWLGFTAWEEWWDQQGLTPVAAEQFIYHERLGYAGCIDLIALGDQGLEILDWKSSNYLLAKHHVQVAAYKRAAECFKPITRARLVRVPKTLANIEIEVRELGDTFNMSSQKHERRSEDELMRAFCGGLEVHRVFFREQ